MSRCAHGVVPTNSFRNSAAVIAPPYGPPMLRMSATCESSSLRYSLASGSCHSDSSVRGRRRLHLVDERLVVADHGGDLRAERRHRSAGERGDVDDRIGTVLDGERQAVGQHQAALGVGVVDLGGLAVAEREHVAELERAARRQVVGAHQVAGHLRLALQRLEGAHRTEHGRGAAHVHLHLHVHAVGRLQADAARVVHDALADEHEVSGRVLRRVGELHHARRLDAALVDADHAAAAHREELVLVEHLDAEAGLGCDGDGALGHLASRQVCRRGVGEIAGEPRGACRHLAALHSGAHAGTALVTGDEADAGQRAGARRVGLETDVLVGRQQRTLGDRLTGGLRVDTFEIGERRGDAGALARRAHERSSGRCEGCSR